MVTVADEVESESRMVCESYRQLQKKFPSHELLSLIRIGEDQIIESGDFQIRYGVRGERGILRSYGYYRKALDEALSGGTYLMSAREAIAKLRADRMI